MISGDGIAEVQKTISRFDISYRIGFRLEGLEERRVMNVGGGFFPLILFGFRSFQSVPSVSTF